MHVSTEDRWTEEVSREGVSQAVVEIVMTPTCSVKDKEWNQ